MLAPGGTVVREMTVIARHVALVVVGAAVLAVILPSSRELAGAAVPGDNGLIVFSSTRESDAGRLYSMMPDGSGLLTITETTSWDSSAAWSPDGLHIAFQRDTPDHQRDIVVVNAGGSGEFKVTDDTIYDNDPAWSPDGTRVVFNSSRGGAGTDLHVWDGATGEITQLTQLGDTLQPDWSPDGARITFARFMGEPGKYEIFVMNADGSDVTQITFNGAASSHPNWSPDGASIAFTSNHEPVAGIYSVNPDGSGQTRLSAPNESGYRPVWSPDDTMIVYSQIAGLFTIPAAGGLATPLPGSVAGDESAHWQRLSMPGDTDCDDLAGIADLLPVLSFMAGILPLAPCLAMGNLNCDFALDAEDVILKLKQTANIPFELPPGCAIG